MAINISPVFRVTAYPASAITKDDVSHQNTSDDFGGLLQRDQSESGGTLNTGFRGTGPGNQANTWTSQPAFESMNEVKLILLGARGGRVYEGAHAVEHAKDGGVLGVILQEREAFCDNFLNPPVSGDPTGTGLPMTRQVIWQPTAGTDWHTVTPTMRPVTSRIMYTTATPNLQSGVQTVGVLPSDGSFRLDLSFAGAARQNEAATFSVTWGGQHMVTWVEEGHPTYSRYVSDGKGTGFRVMRTFGEVPKTLMHGPHKMNVRFRVRLIGNRLMLDFDALSFDVLNTQPVSPPPAAGTAPPVETKAVVTTWPTAPIAVSCYGVRAAFAVHPVIYARLEEYDGSYGILEGSFKRVVYTDFAPGGGTATGSGYARGAGILPSTVSFVGFSDSTTTPPTWTANTGGGGNLVYTCTLSGDNPQVALLNGTTTHQPGIHTPFVTGVICKSDSGPSFPVVNGIDITRACIGQGSIDSAEPPGMVTKEAKIRVHRKILDGLYPGHSWTAYVRPFNPIRIEVAWRDSDGHLGSYATLFDGYIMTPNKTLESVNKYEMDLLCRDQTVRLSPPAAFIDGKFKAPLDVIALQTGNVVYGASMAREVIRTVLGDHFGDGMNGGLSNDLRFMPPGHYPLLSQDTDTVGLYGNVVPMSNGPLFPPPFGSSAIEWINHTIGPMDANGFVYFDVPPDGVVSTPCFIYGRTTQLFKAAQAAGSGGVNLVVGDDIYVSNTANQVLQSASNSFIAENSINEIQVWGPRNAGFAQPSSSMGRYNLPPYDLNGNPDPNSQEKSWRRTLLLEPNFIQASDQDVVQDIAFLAGQEYRGCDHADVSITMRGQAQLTPFMVIRPTLSGTYSDSTIGLNGINFRVKRVTHTLDFQYGAADTFVTTAHCRSLSSSGF